MTAIPAQRLAALIVGVGIVGALHVGKLPPVIPVLAAEMGLTLVQGGFLLAVIQLAGMCLGAVAGLMADRLGPRRVMMTGLGLLGLGSALGALAPSATVLLLTRAVEGLGFLLAVLPAPALLRRELHDLRVLNRMLGVWGAYMPIGAATALWLAPGLYEGLGWRATWWLLVGLTWAMAVLVWRWVPPDRSPQSILLPPVSMAARLQQTLSAPGPWGVALAFMMYSGQWLAVVGFLPTIYTGAGWPPAWVGALSALAAGVNLIGNIAAGRLLGAGWRPVTLLSVGYISMAVGALVAFSAWGGTSVQYLAVLVFSAVGGLIPGTLFALAVRLAPSAQTVSTTVGWVQQLSSLGQFVGPPLVAWVASRAGGWHLTWVFNLACGVAGMVLAVLLQRRLSAASV
jgi:MFS family permease